MRVAIIGQGYVGLTISAFAAEHHEVFGFDMNAVVVERLNQGVSHIEGVDSVVLKKWIDAGLDLGASKWQIFSKIFWRLTQSGVNNGCIMVFLPAMTLFYIPNILGGAKSILVGNLIQNEFLVLNNWPQGAASSSILSLILIGFFYFTQIKDKRK